MNGSRRNIDNVHDYLPLSAVFGIRSDVSMAFEIAVSLSSLAIQVNNNAPQTCLITSTHSFLEGRSSGSGITMSREPLQEHSPIPSPVGCAAKDRIANHLQRTVITPIVFTLEEP